MRFKTKVEANPQTFLHPATAQDKDGRIYDPRQGLGGYYRYGPRDLYLLGTSWLSRKGNQMLPRIHQSVFERIHNNARLYAPKGLPEQYEVVTADRQVLAPGEPVPNLRKPYETPDQAKARQHIQARAWNTIWLRRIVYFMTVAVSIYLVTFPVLRASPRSAELTSPLRWASDVVRIVGAYLPPAATPWIDGYARNPDWFIIVGAALAGMLWWGGWLSARIQNVMGLAWQKSLCGRLDDPGEPRDLIYRLRTSGPYVAMHAALKTYVAPALFAFAFAYLGITLTSHVLFNIQDDLGLVCRETPVKYDHDPRHPNRVKVADYNGLVALDPGETVILSSGKFTKTSGNNIDREKLPEFKTSELCKSMGVWLERNGKHLIKFDSTDDFSDGRIDASEGMRSCRRSEK